MFCFCILLRPVLLVLVSDPHFFLHNDGVDEDSGTIDVHLLCDPLEGVETRASTVDDYIRLDLLEKGGGG